MNSRELFEAEFPPAMVKEMAADYNCDIDPVLYMAFQVGMRAAAPKPQEFEVMEINTLRNMLAWVDSRIEAEVTHRPDVNIYKEMLSNTWNQMRQFLLERIKETGK